MLKKTAPLWMRVLIHIKLEFACILITDSSQVHRRVAKHAIFHLVT
jgi:hypothetical protein